MSEEWPGAWFGAEFGKTALAGHVTSCLSHLFSIHLRPDT